MTVDWYLRLGKCKRREIQAARLEAESRKRMNARDGSNGGGWRRPGILIRAFFKEQTDMERSLVDTLDSLFCCISHDKLGCVVKVN